MQRRRPRSQRQDGDEQSARPYGRWRLRHYRQCRHSSAGHRTILSPSTTSTTSTTSKTGSLSFHCCQIDGSTKRSSPFIVPWPSCTCCCPFSPFSHDLYRPPLRARPSTTPSAAGSAVLPPSTTTTTSSTTTTTGTPSLPALAMVNPQRDVATTLAMAAAQGDLETVKYLIDSKLVDVNACKKKGGNTALHAALAQNHTHLVEYLISAGADVNMRNSRGQTPLMMAIASSHGLLPVKRLLAAGADVTLKSWRYKQTALDIARIKRFTLAIPLLEAAAKTAQQEPSLLSAESLNTPAGRTRCPICNDLVRLLPRLSFVFDGDLACLGLTHLMRVPQDSAEAHKASLSPSSGLLFASSSAPLSSSAEKQSTTQPPSSDQSSRVDDVSTPDDVQGISGDQRQQPEREIRVPLGSPYIEKFLKSVAFERLRTDPKYHTLADKHHLRKEVTETWAIMHAVEQQCEELGLDLDNITLVDLCSGKSLTSALFGMLYPNSRVIAIDRMPVGLVPHFDDNVVYLQQDIMKDTFVDVLKNTLDPSRPALLVGMHLCGVLSLQAIHVFTSIPQFRGIVLSPCCFPSRRSGIRLVRDSGLVNELDKYEFWTQHLAEEVCKLTSNCQCYKDQNIYSNRNNVIYATR
eukprot:m.195787 g.195787  ORF g.195787 m.195787 type:complete len:633 (-) comp16810_c2_seq1:54-1952(-)